MVSSCPIFLRQCVEEYQEYHDKFCAKKDDMMGGEDGMKDLDDESIPNASIDYD
jgi:hypothetical protein